MIPEDVKLTSLLARFYSGLIRKHGQNMALLVNPVEHYLPAARGVAIKRGVHAEPRLPGRAL